jgi:hypothetical protein
MNTRANEQIEQFIALGLVLIQAAVDYAGGAPDDRPPEEVSADIRRLLTMTSALQSALMQAERRPAAVTAPASQSASPTFRTS